MSGGWADGSGGFGASGTAAMRLGGGDQESARADLAAADAQVRDALDALRQAEALGWRSQAADAFRARLAAVVATVWGEAAALDTARTAATRLGVSG